MIAPHERTERHVVPLDHVVEIVDRAPGSHPDPFLVLGISRR